MLDEPVEDVTPVSATRPLVSFGLRSRPSYGQLMRWAACSRRMGLNRKAPVAESEGKHPGDEGELIDKDV